LLNDCGAEIVEVTSEDPPV